VVFTVRGPSPSCGVAGKKFVRGRPGLNRVRLDGRFDGHALAPGTYEIVVVARHGKAHSRVGRISIQVVPPGSRVRRPGAAPAFRCVAPAAQAGIPGAGLFLSPPSANRGGGQDAKPGKRVGMPSRSGVLAEPPFHVGKAPGGLDTLLAILLYGTLGLGSVVFLAYLVKAFRSSARP